MWAHPMERPGRPQNQRKNMTYFRTYFFNQKMQEYEKKGSQKGPKRVSIFPGWRPWGRLGRPNLFLNTKSMPKVLQRWPPGCKSDSKMLQRWPPGSLNSLLQERQNALLTTIVLSHKDYSWQQRLHANPRTSGVNIPIKIHRLEHRCKLTVQLQDTRPGGLREALTISKDIYICTVVGNVVNVQYCFIFSE